MSTPTAWAPFNSTFGGSIATRAALTALTIPLALPGMTYFCRELGFQGLYVFSLDSGATVNGTTVLATTVGGASRWLAQEGGIGPGVRAFQSVAQSIPNFVFTAVSFTSEDYDDADMHDNAVNPSRITIPVGQGGRYLLIANVSYAANITGARGSAIRKNGTTIIASTNDQAIPGGLFGNSLICTSINELAEGEYVEALAFQASGVALLTFTGSSNTYFAAQRLK